MDKIDIYTHKNNKRLIKDFTLEKNSLENVPKKNVKDSYQANGNVDYVIYGHVQIVILSRVKRKMVTINVTQMI